MQSRLPRFKRAAAVAPMQLEERDRQIIRPVHRHRFLRSNQIVALTHQKRMRMSNALERVNQEIKRRTRVARFFPNDASLLHLITALQVETSEEWESGKIYLNMENQNSPSV